MNTIPSSAPCDTSTKSFAAVMEVLSLLQPAACRQRVVNHGAFISRRRIGSRPGRVGETGFVFFACLENGLRTDCANFGIRKSGETAGAEK
jgi:hypothetical protein